MSQIFIEKWKTKPNGYNFFKYSLIFAFSTILAENKYILTYLIRISIKIAQNKYTYWKKVSRRNPAVIQWYNVTTIYSKWERHTDRSQSALTPCLQIVASLRISSIQSRMADTLTKPVLSPHWFSPAGL